MPHFNKIPITTKNNSNKKLLPMYIMTASKAGKWDLYKNDANDNIGGCVFLDNYKPFLFHIKRNQKI